MRNRAVSPRRDDCGFSMVEIMVAFSILLTVTAAMIPLLLRSTEVSATNRFRVTAANLAEQHLELLRHGDPANFPVGRNTRVVTTNNVVYTVATDLSWVSQATNGTSAGSCDGGANGALAYLRADVIVTWPNMKPKPVTSSTLIRPGIRSAQPGTIAVKVLNRAGTPAPGHRVTLSHPGGSSSAQTTDSRGCAFFARLPLGSYTAALATPGYVDLANNPSPSRGLTLTSTSPGPAAWNVTYDRP